MARLSLREDNVLLAVAFKFKISHRKILFVDFVSGKAFSVGSLVAG
jgi:hypothetical protein